MSVQVLTRLSSFFPFLAAGVWCEFVALHGARGVWCVSCNFCVHVVFVGRKLHDDVPPMAASRVSKVLSRELDEPVEELFRSFNLTHPVGSASISQVQCVSVPSYVSYLSLIHI